MRHVRLNQPRSDCLLIDEGRDWQRAAAWVGVSLLWVSALVLLQAESALWWGAMLTAHLALPVAALSTKRLLRRRSLSVVRTPGRMMLDGEPLELARVELRVTHWPVLKTPNGYALSLWVMTATGPQDVPLGHFTSMLEASKLGGHLEEFIARAGNRQHGRTPLS